MRISRSIAAFGIGVLMLTSMALAAPVKPKFPVTTAKANAIVLKQFAHGKIVGKTKLENEEGTWQYGIMVRNGKVLREVMVNAKTGHIDSVEVTNASKERVEAKQDAAAEKKAATKKKGDAKAATTPEKGTKTEKDGAK